MRHRVSSRSGLTLVDVVIGLLVLALLQPLLITSISLALNTDFQWVQRQNQIGVLQLRRKLALGVKLIVSIREVSAVINDQRVYWVCQGNNLIQNPGAMPYLIDLSSCGWRKEGEYLILAFTGGNVHQELIVGIFP